MSEVQVTGFRYYSPGLGRWINRDPIGEHGQNMARVPTRSPRLGPEAEVALIERPRQTLTVVSYFSSRDDALDFVDSGVAGRSLRPAGDVGANLCVRPRGADTQVCPYQSAKGFRFLSLEYFDSWSLDFMRPKYPDIPTDSAAAILFEIPYGESGKHNPSTPG